MNSQALVHNSIILLSVIRVLCRCKTASNVHSSRMDRLATNCIHNSGFLSKIQSEQVKVRRHCFLSEIQDSQSEYYMICNENSPCWDAVACSSPKIEIRNHMLANSVSYFEVTRKHFTKVSKNVQILSQRVCKASSPNNVRFASSLQLNHGHRKLYNQIVTNRIIASLITYITPIQERGKDSSYLILGHGLGKGSLQTSPAHWSCDDRK